MYKYGGNHVRSCTDEALNAETCMSADYIPGVPKKVLRFLITLKRVSAITLKYILLHRGKANLDFDILQLYIYKKLTEILMFKFGSIFLDVSKICEKTAYQILTKRC